MKKIICDNKAHKVTKEEALAKYNVQGSYSNQDTCKEHLLETILNLLDGSDSREIAVIMY